MPDDAFAEPPLRLVDPVLVAWAARDRDLVDEVFEAVVGLVRQTC